MALGLNDYKTMARSVETELQKINFFDECIKAFFLDSKLTEFESALKCFFESEGLSDEELDALENIEWRDLSDKFKLIAFQKCIIEGSAYKEFDTNKDNVTNISCGINTSKAA
ncbi:hypothetical protein [Prochlorococcus sp. MIT 1223]|uniref:hypothetical protein n=1 Tax=Prochlorococcus sp. MIT 1223 TaxID=3096217 RepID=UPI002A760D8C|nr:hypothetical protein [Prochlorococcus sp. MIT 1223]